jgi:NAD(P)-dependent dehydrogenase (short-subunit alcohol dehydrogenase family)
VNTLSIIGPFVDFGGRRVVVSGASSGIGRAIAVELSRRGASLVLMGRNKDRLEETAAMLATKDVDSVVLDLVDSPLVLPTIKDIVARRGRLYGLCHCAGQVETVPLNAIQPDSLRRLYEVNVVAGLELAQAVSRRDVMTEGGGSILFVSSIYASVGMAGQIGYSATKGALISVARAMAVELARRQIRVNTVSPGLVHTRLADAALSQLSPERTRALEQAHPLGPGVPEDVARAVVFTMCPQTRWMTGTDLVIDGGYTAQ